MLPALRAHATRARYFGARMLARQTRSLADAAVARAILSPAETCIAVPPRMLPAHVHKMCGTGLDEPLGDVVAHMQATTEHHAATEAFTLEGVALFGHHLFAPPARIDLFRSEAPGPDVQEIDDAVLVTSYAGTRWFGHFIHDDLPLQLLPSSSLAIAHARAPYAQEAAYRALFSVPAPRRVGRAFLRRLTVFVDHSQNASKRARYRTLRARVPHDGPPTRVFLRRTGGQTRILEGEDHLVDELARRGFVILRNDDPVDVLVETCRRAEQIVTVDGSHVAPLLFVLPDHAEVVNLLPAARISPTITDVARAAGLRTAVFVCEGTADRLTVDVDELLRFVDA